MIREFQILDIEQVMKLCFFGNVDTHSFMSEGFSILSEGVDEDTGQKEYTICWGKL